MDATEVCEPADLPHRRPRSTTLWPVCFPFSLTRTHAPINYAHQREHCCNAKAYHQR